MLICHTRTSIICSRD